MSKKVTYIEQLSELYKNYAGKEIEQAIGVTVRSVQNYLKEDNPSTPGPDVVQKIREAFAKHERGEPINSPPPEKAGDLLELYINEVKKNTLLEKRVSEINDIESRLTEVEKGLAEAKKAQQVMYAVHMAYMEQMLVYLAGDNYANAQKKVAERAATFLKKAQQEGIGIG